MRRALIGFPAAWLALFFGLPFLLILNVPL